MFLGNKRKDGITKFKVSAILKKERNTMGNMLKRMFDKTIEDFEKEFCGETVELFIFTLKGVNGAAILKDGYNVPSVHFAASVNVETKEFSRMEGRLEWLVSPEEYQDKGWIYQFEPYRIHHIKCRKRPIMDLEPYMSEVSNNCYQLLEYISDDESEHRLQALIEEYTKPVIIEDAIGIFTLNRAYSWFEGSVAFNQTKVSVMFDADENNQLPPKAFAYLKTFIEDIQNQDERIRKFIVKALWETANDWIESEEAEHLTEEYFHDSLYLSELSVSHAGNMTLYYGDEKDIFAGHAIEVNVNINGEIMSAILVG